MSRIIFFILFVMSIVTYSQDFRKNSEPQPLTFEYFGEYDKKRRPHSNHALVKVHIDSIDNSLLKNTYFDTSTSYLWGYMAFFHGKAVKKKTVYLFKDKDLKNLFFRGHVKTNRNKKLSLQLENGIIKKNNTCYILDSFLKSDKFPDENGIWKGKNTFFNTKKKWYTTLTNFNLYNRPTQRINYFKDKERTKKIYNGHVNNFMNPNGNNGVLLLDKLIFTSTWKNGDIDFTKPIKILGKNYSSKYISEIKVNPRTEIRFNAISYDKKLENLSLSELSNFYFDGNTIEIKWMIRENGKLIPKYKTLGEIKRNNPIGKHLLYEYINENWQPKESIIMSNYYIDTNNFSSSNNISSYHISGLNLFNLSSKKQAIAYKEEIKKIKKYEELREARFRKEAGDNIKVVQSAPMKGKHYTIKGKTTGNIGLYLVNSSSAKKLDIKITYTSLKTKEKKVEKIKGNIGEAFGSAARARNFIYKLGWNNYDVIIDISGDLDGIYYYFYYKGIMF